MIHIHYPGVSGPLECLEVHNNITLGKYLEIKFQVFMMGEFGNLSPEEQANQTADGYHHTYFNADDIDLAVLMQYPADEQLVNASKYAFEAAQRLRLVGITADGVPEMQKFARRNAMRVHWEEEIPKARGI